MADQKALDDDERMLAELGYKQELSRTWSGFSNFAISFSIISILAGCFTTFYFGWNNGGPIAISWGWPIICALILMVAFSMAELASSFPTAGAIYWWSARLGGRKWGWYTGWFNLIGLVGVTASVVYGSAAFLNTVLQIYGLDLGFINFNDAEHALTETFVLFALILSIHALINIFSSPLVAHVNNVSVWWHVVGVAVIIGLLIFVPSDHASFDFVFTQTFNNTGLFDGSTATAAFWFYILPLGFLLTMYTQTGYDASAHISEETHGAATSAARFCSSRCLAPAANTTVAIDRRSSVVSGGSSSIGQPRWANAARARSPDPVSTNRTGEPARSDGSQRRSGARSPGSASASWSGSASCTPCPGSPTA